MIKIRVSGGYTGSVVGVLSHRDGADISGGSYKIGLFDPAITVDNLPSASDPGWKTPTSVDTSTTGRVTLTLAVSSGSGYTVPGRYRVWAKASLAPFVLVAAARDETIQLV